MSQRKISTVIDDMILQRLLSACTDDDEKKQAAEAKLDELKQELEGRCGAMVVANVRELKEAGLI